MFLKPQFKKNVLAHVLTSAKNVINVIKLKILLPELCDQSNTYFFHSELCVELVDENGRSADEQRDD